MPELVSIVITWGLVSLSGVVAPGPVSAMAVGQGARWGAIAGPLITAGHALSEALVVCLLAFGVHRVLESQAVVGGLGVAGGAVLMGMGWGLLGTARREQESFLMAPGRPPTTRWTALVRAGVLATVGNPYWLLWWATVGAHYFLRFRRYGYLAVIGLFFGGHILLDLSWNTVLSAAVGMGHRRLPAGAYRLLLSACGLFLLVLGAQFLYSGLRLLL